MAKSLSETNPQWRPTAQQLEVIDLLATGYSQLAISRLSGIPQPTIWSWLNELSFSEQFREIVDTRAAEFHAAKDAVHNQQVVLALDLVQQALTGEMQRERVGESVATPLRLETAISLLRATFWKQLAGGHSKFGAS